MDLKKFAADSLCSTPSRDECVGGCRTMNRNSLSTDQELRQGEHLMSLNGNYQAILQTDGNFVIYKWTPTWASSTNTEDTLRLLLQPDNNLVIYNNKGAAVWASGTHSNSHTQRMRLTMQNDGRLVLDKDGNEVWSVGGK
ncbi:B-type lectin plumieribetin-like isoform X1 [Solea solea]|uniref:B-type lectin plumieribetin-like isoform X1 n=2 Tax=Solea solea TaxID=90069 RepID=UPI00272B08E0|nr:B-type lectin plumieribetin-like isoform X1 [Solea solea]